MLSQISRRARCSTARIITAPVQASRAYSNWPMLKEEHVQIRDMCRSFADEELSPNAGKWDREHIYPAEAIKKLGELGMMGVGVSTDFGGSGMDTVSYAIAVEEVRRRAALPST